MTYSRILPAPRQTDSPGYCTRRPGGRRLPYRLQEPEWIGRWRRPWRGRSQRTRPSRNPCWPMENVGMTGIVNHLAMRLYGAAVGCRRWHHHELSLRWSLAVALVPQFNYSRSRLAAPKYRVRRTTYLNEHSQRKERKLNQELSIVRVS